MRTTRTTTTARPGPRPAGSPGARPPGPAHRLRLAVVASAATLVLTSCAGSISDAYVVENDPGHSEPIAGTDLHKVTLTPAAARRLGVDTTTVREHRRGLTAPSTAVFVDPHGHWWVYTSPEPHAYVRHAISEPVERNGRAVFRKGPAPGTQVVTVGVAELYGIEEEVGH